MVKLHLAVVFLASLSSKLSWPWFPCFIVFFFISLFHLRSLSAVLNSFYLLHLFSISPYLSRSLISSPPSHFRSSFSSFLLHFLSICSHSQFVISHPFRMTSPCQTTPRQFHLNMFLHSDLHSQVTRSSLIKSLNSHNSSYQVGFANLDLLLLFLG